MGFFSGITSRFQSLFSDPLHFLLDLLITLLAMCVAISFHECAHAWTAWKLGDPTAKNMGRLTLDPIKHMDLWGLLMFALVGIGWAKPVVVNSRNFKNFRRDDVLVSLAGPAVNLILSFLFSGLWYLLQMTFHVSNEIVLAILSELITLNLFFAIFNLLPVPPLDGFHIISSVFVKKAYRVVEWLWKYGYFILIGLLITGVVSWLLSFAGNAVLSVFDAFWGLFW